MNEADFLTCASPQKMLSFLRGKVSERKLRLVACACLRRIWHRLRDERCRRAIEVAELFADGKVTKTQLYRAHRGAEYAQQAARSTAWLAAWRANRFTMSPSTYADRAAEQEADALNAQAANRASRRPLTWEDAWFATTRVEEADAERKCAAVVRDVLGNPFVGIGQLRPWLTPAVKALARVVYEERRFEDLPILADALEDAGCIHADILAHCRQPGEHVRGCWVVDALLGKK